MTLIPAERRCIIYKDPVEVRAKLRDLTIPLELLIEAAQQGFVERSNATRFDPVTSAGTDAWRYPVRVIRVGLEELGWRLDDPQNLPLAISDVRSINVTVSSGDELTGIDGAKFPRSKNPKGALIDAAVARNLGQGDLFPDLLPARVRVYERTLKYPTWMLLLYITDKEIRAELSLPNAMNYDDYIYGWAERILIPVPLPGEERLGDTHYDEGPEIVPVVTAKI